MIKEKKITVSERTSKEAFGGCNSPLNLIVSQLSRTQDELRSFGFHEHHFGSLGCRHEHSRSICLWSFPNI